MIHDPKRQKPAATINWKAEQPSDFKGNWKRVWPDNKGKAHIKVGAEISLECKNFPADSEFFDKTFPKVRWHPPADGESGFLQFENTHKGVTTTYRIQPATPRGRKRSIECVPEEGELPESWEAEEGG